MAEIPKAPIKRILKAAGAQRVSESAAEVMVYHTERFVKTIAKKSTELARHAKRKTITEKDIEIAVKDLLG